MRTDMEKALKSWQEDMPPTISNNMRHTLRDLPEKRRKVPKAFALLAFAACLLLVFFFTPLGQQALAAIANGFSRFTGRYANNDARMESLAEHAYVPETTANTSLPVEIDGVYYDGYTLKLSYSINDASALAEDYSPSWEELAQMRKISAAIALPRGDASAQSADARLNAVMEARKNGEPCGYRKTATHLEDGVYTTDGIALVNASADYDQNGAALYGIAAYDIPEELQGRDEFTAEFAFTRREILYYFDGQQDYYLERIDAEEKKQVRVQMDAGGRQYAGSGSFADYSAQVELHAGSALITGTITLTPSGDTASREAWLARHGDEATFGQLPVYYYLFDAEGNRLAEDDLYDGSRRDESHLYIDIEIAAVDNLPDILILRPMQSGEYAEDGIELRIH